MRTVRAVLGLALAGYGLTILLGLVAHEAAWIGWASLALGAALVASLAVHLPSRRLPGPPSSESPSPPSSPPPSSSPPSASPSPIVRGVLAVLGLCASVGTAAYNVARGSGLTVAEAALVVYGAALVAALPWLDRRVAGRATGMTVVAWSLPVLLAPLLIYALNGLLTSQAGAQAAAASPLVGALLVAPTAALLELLGHDVALRGQALVLATPRGSLTLSVGLVCAGIYPVVLFASIFALYAWDRRPPAARAWRQLAAGLIVLWMLNLLRMVVLAKVGVARGTAALQAVHDQIGWLLFAAFSVGYWWIVLRRPVGPHEPPASSAS